MNCLKLINFLIFILIKKILNNYYISNETILYLYKYRDIVMNLIKQLLIVNSLL